MRRSLLPGSDQLSVLVATIALAYTLARVLALPTRLVETTLLGAPVAAGCGASLDFSRHL